METIKKDTYTIIIDKTSSLIDFSEVLSNELENFSNENLIIDLEHEDNLSVEELLIFLDASNSHYDNNKSFIIVNASVDIDEVPEELRLVPTMQEAEDMVQMEEIERDLGF